MGGRSSSCSRVTSGALVLLGFAVASSWAAPARANGRFPYANQLVVDPGDPLHIVLRTTYGVLQSVDGGKKWTWVCEKAVGYSGTLDPAIGVTKDGTTIVGTFDGLSLSHDRHCTWTSAGPVLSKQFVIDVAVEAKNPSRAVALTSTGLGDGFHVILAESIDDAKTWTQAGVTLPKDFNSETVDVAPSDTDRIYASGIVGTPRAGFIERSDDRGKSWTRLPIDLGGGKAPFIAAIDPAQADLLYARIQGETHDTVVVSNDGAKSWKTIYESVGQLQGFALSPDGGTLAVGGPKDGIFTASRGDYVFSRASTIGARCLTWTSEGLYACASEYPDGFTVGLSKDGAKSFAQLYHLSELDQLVCAATTTTGIACPPFWPAVQDTIGQERPDGGVTDASPSDAGTSPAATPRSCGCKVMRGDESDAKVLTFIGAFVALVWSRARRRRE